MKILGSFQTILQNALLVTRCFAIDRMPIERFGTVDEHANRPMDLRVFNRSTLKAKGFEF